VLGAADDRCNDPRAETVTVSAPEEVAARQEPDGFSGLSPSAQAAQEVYDKDNQQYRP
jgi:hypothetical protein